VSTPPSVLNPPQLEARHSAGVYSKRAITLVRGLGARVWDSEGREYIDCVGGQGTANLGHANAAVAEALARQAGELISCPEMFPNAQRAALLVRLAELSGLPRAFLCNSGTEAVEAALKFARISTGRAGVIAALRGFHGRTLGALSATWNRAYREGFEPLVPGFSHVPYNRLDRLEAAVGDGTAAVILEVVQGEGGVHLGEPDFLAGAQRLCRERGALLILDEVQTGIGRTGRLFAYQHYGLEPDLVCLAKSLAGGVPIGATLIGPRVGTLPPHSHGSTFGGNPLACAAALAALGEVERLDLPARAAALGAHFLERLRALEHPAIREVRGLGLLVGVELRGKAAPVVQALMARGVLALTAGLNVLRFLPPLVISKTELDQVVGALAAALAGGGAAGDAEGGAEAGAGG
jgi:acetylornithine/LysW-gamma-L-lysine aminotransferase